MAKTVALVFGIVFIAVGLLGFLGTPIVGAEGLFLTDTAHDLVHLLIGLAGVVMALYGEAMAVMYLKVFGAVYGLVALLGFVALVDGKILGLITANAADNWLHVVLALVMLWAGFSLGGAKPMSSMGGGSGMSAPGSSGMPRA